MARILIIYGTNEGHTRTIAEYIAERIRAKGYEADTADSTASPPPSCSIDFDAYIVGGSVHEGRHQRSLIHFVRENLSDLQRLPSAFFSVSLASAIQDDEHRKEAWGYIEKFSEETGWHPDLSVAVAGALLYTKYDFFKRLLMKLIVRHQGGDTDTSRDYVYTRWEEVDRFVEEFIREYVALAVSLLR